MKPRLIAIFLLLVLSPLALLTWFGWRAAADEQVRVRSTISQAYANQLTSLRSLIHEVISEREREFASLLTPGLIGRSAAVRELVRNQRFVRQAFILSPDGGFAHPPADESQRTEAERQFFDRTNSIWLSGEKFTSAGENSSINRVLAENIPPPASRTTHRPCRETRPGRSSRSPSRTPSSASSTPASHRPISRPIRGGTAGSMAMARR